MPTLTIPLKGMLGGFSDAPRSEWRLTKRSPTTTNIHGLLAACLGLERDDDWTVVKRLKIQVTGQYHGTELLRDYQTVQGAITNDGTPGRNAITQREYVVQADYLVHITGGDEIIEELKHAVRHPVYQPYLGRKSCVPSAPLWLPEVAS